MEYVHITVDYGGEKSVDLSLPWTVPVNMFLSAILSELGLAQIPGHKLILAVRRQDQFRQISDTETLADADVVFGDVLDLFPWKRAYLVAENGSKYNLGEGFTSIGRSDQDRKVDIDLADLDQAKVISRRQGTVKHIHNQYYIKDENSSNGILLNEQRIASGDYQLLAEGDRIRCGGEQGVSLKFHYQALQ
jgi:uncharacterized ubiquitin-like protein YukD